MKSFTSIVSTKIKKIHKHKVLGREWKPHLLELTTGFAGLKALENGRLTPKQLETIRRIITRKMQRTGKVWFHIYPNLAITKKPKEVRMGKGKGAINLWVANIKQGKILVEISQIHLDLAKEIFKTVAAKLPIKTLLVFQQKDLNFDIKKIN
jgi:large subunit ribosomal protein L16